MTPDIATEERIFEAALGFEDAADRERYVAEACAGNPALEKRIRGLLGHAASAEPFFHLPTVIRDSAHAAVAKATTVDQTGEQIGPYRLVEKIGTGGEGSVYAAEQEEPVRRMVAVKLMGIGFSGPETVKRFVAERQTLAMMEHPNIARIHDAGATPEGIPWFAMELVRGIRITTFCDQARLGLRARLKLYLQVCNGVQHAHQKGIIHRDLKPANVLVRVDDGIPSAKIIDFGIAKAAQETAGEEGRGPSGVVMAGTPKYMSPEQFLGSNDIDTRSDVYSLGVLLYELLSGQWPYAKPAPAGSPNEVEAIRRLVGRGACAAMEQQLELLPLEEQLETARQRSTTPRQLRATLTGDLQPILAKCLALDREQRYQTASELGDDLRRYLKNEPVLARPGTRLYRATKFAARNKIAVTAGMVVAVALTVGIFLSTSAFLQERRAKNRVEEARQREENERKRAEAGELRARRFAYASDMNLAQQALEINNRGRAREILERNRPKPGEVDLRGWEWRHLWAATRSDAIQTMPRQQSSILAAGYGAGQRIVTRDGTFDIRLWHRPDQQELLHTNIQGYGRAIAIEPEGKLVILTALLKGKPFIRQIEVEKEREWKDYPVESSPYCLAISADRTLAAGICIDEKARIWRLDRFETLKTYATGGAVGWNKGAAAFAPAGGLAAFGISDGTVTVIDTKSLEVVTNFVASKEGVTAMAFSADGTRIATGSGFSDTTLKIWKARDGTLVRTLNGHHSWISSLAFTRDGKKLATGSGDQTIRIWDTTEWKTVSVLRGHTDEVYTVGFSPDDKNLVSGSKSGEVMFWEAAQVGRADAFEKYARKVFAFAPMAERADFLALRRVNLALLEVKTARFEENLVGTADGEALLAVNPDSKMAAVATQNGTVAVWDLQAKKVGKHLEIKPGKAALLEFTRGRPERLVALDSQRNVHVWSVDTWDRLASWRVETGERTNINVSAAAISRDGTILATGLVNGALQTWDLQSGRRLTETNAHARSISGIDFSPDGKTMATGSEDALIKLWRVSDWQNCAVMKGHVLGVHSVAYSPDGSRLVSGSVDTQAIKVWDMATMQELITLKAAGTSFRQTRFTSDGKSLASANEEGVLYIWSADHQ